MDNAPGAPLTPEEIEAERLETGRLLFARPVAFVRGVVDMTGLPEDDRPEIAFAGRSNVGKSSLINALLSRKNLARASAEPGRTREINFFDLDERLYIVDLPGFGYAKASKSLIKQWTKLTRDYLRGRTSLKRVFLLVDSRRGPMDTDEEVMTLLDQSATVYQVVLTKADKLKASEGPAVIEAVRKVIARHPAAHPEILVTSSETGVGMAELRAEIAELTA